MKDASLTATTVACASTDPTHAFDHDTIERLTSLLHEIAVATRGYGVPDVLENLERLPDEIEAIWEQVDGG